VLCEKLCINIRLVDKTLLRYKEFEMYENLYLNKRLSNQIIYLFFNFVVNCLYLKG